MERSHNNDRETELRALRQRLERLEAEDSTSFAPSLRPRGLQSLRKVLLGTLFGAFVMGAASLLYGGESGADALMIDKDGNVRAGVGEFLGKGAVPRGAIVMWSGDPAKLPQGWVLCDGSNNICPNLGGRFIVGYAPGGDYAKIGTPGGTPSNTVGLADLGDHTHVLGGTPIYAVSTHAHSVGNHGHQWAGSWTTDNGSQNTSTSTASTVGFGLERQQINTGGIVASPRPVKTLDNRPPYMVLAYIMYIGK